MAIDNRFEQAEQLVASDERREPPQAVTAVLKVVEKILPGSGSVISAIRFESEKEKAENIELMREIVWEELKRVSSVVDDFGRDPDRLKRLTLDAVRKAEDLRDTERVKRIGKILAHALTLPMSDFDKAEEMMRVARDLSDPDVLGIRHLYDTQFHTPRRCLCVKRLSGNHS